METYKFHKTECGVDFLLNVVHLESADDMYLKKMPFNTDFFEIVFFKKTSGRLILNHQQIDLTDNSIIFISPYQKRQWYFDEDKEQNFTILIFQEDFLNDFFSDKLFTYKLLYFYQLHFPVEMVVDKDFIQSYCTFLIEIKAELINPKADSEHIIRSLLYYILQKLNREYATRNNLDVQKENKHYAFQFKQLIEIHIKEKQRIADYAEILGISRVSLNSAVKEQFNVTATHLLKQRLVLEIKNYLIHSKLTVSEIAYKLHFSEPNHLMRLFKAQTGFTTSEFLSDSGYRALV
ncbi:AraC family transcriptional regulator, transcriptional activator of pobA [Flavobacterium anhuiense]|uniref:AraC family transcriptional regulator, transcriptional activator of pobA n=1 Tax=Flavobacterium anhuiense TaxID=459526 RepID=A0ABY0LXE1_9FLAO|nr:AraC family transcriptional regulator [Flavobacterium anhuiense]SCY75842.1 AraC family transcriptional regulator, transcriptional activator of pobA [Flavobacterium anhuiense]